MTPQEIQLWVLIVYAVLHVLYKCYMSVKKRRFKSSCSSCCTIDYSSEHRDGENTEIDTTEPKLPGV
jgi:hypothetical protein